MSFITEHLADLEKFSAMSKTAGARADYVQGGGGNTSMKTDDGFMCIKASGFKLSDVTTDNAYAVIDYKPLAAFYGETDPAGLEDIEAAGSAKAKEYTRTYEDLPALRPSVEAGFHSILDKFVVHTHAVYANLASCADNCEEILEKALGDAPYAYTAVDYTDPGAKLTFIIADAIKKTVAAKGKRPAIIIMKNHGIISTSDDADEALRLHDDANKRIAAYFGVDEKNYPQIKLEQTEEGFVSATPYVIDTLASGRYSAEQLLRLPLYPDQMVFFTGTLLIEGEAPRDNACYIDTATGRIHYKGMKQAQAITLEETFCAVLTILEVLREKGLTVQYMGDEARSFISNWESEKYRKSLSQK